jgi:hypothetical protein
VGQQLRVGDAGEPRPGRQDDGGGYYRTGPATASDLIDTSYHRIARLDERAGVTMGGGGDFHRYTIPKMTPGGVILIGLKKLGLNGWAFARLGAIDAGFDFIGRSLLLVRGIHV